MPIFLPFSRTTTPLARLRVWSPGFTLIETTVALAVLGVFFAAVALILQQVLANIAESRIRATALALGQQKMEVIRNLPFASVGTQGGIPAGPIAQTEAVTINGLAFTVSTAIQYIDDPYDNTAPADTTPGDYKRVRVQVTWGGQYPSRVPVSYVTNVVPKGVETTTGGGTLYILVFNAQGQPVANANVRIINTTVVPTIDLNLLTTAQGNLTIPGAPACITCYQITVTKSGYSTDKTYGSADVANPLQPHVTVLTGNLTQTSFTVDQVSSMEIRSFGPKPNYAPIGSVVFTLRGSKIIGYDASDNPVYKFQLTTNTGGHVVGIPNLEWDTYTLSMASSASSLAGSDPVPPFVLPPNTLNVPIRFVGVPKTNNTLLVTVKDTLGTLQASAAANLTNAGLSINLSDFTAATGAADYGQIFFGGLQAAAYQLRVSLPGFIEATSSVTVSGQTQTAVTLNPI